MTPPSREGLKGVKFWLTLSSLSPLFILLPAKYQEVCSLAAKGSKVATFCGQAWAGSAIWVGLVAIFVGVPLAVLAIRQSVAKRDNDVVNVTVESAEDRRDHLIAYLFAVFLPLYQTSADTWPALLALAFSVVFVIWLFYFLNSYYVNPYFALRGYRTFQIGLERRAQSGTRSEPVILLSRRRDVRAGDRIRALRIGEGVYLED